MSPNSRRKSDIASTSLGDQRFGHEVGKLHDEDLFGRIAHPGRVVDDQRFRMDAFENMRRRDVVHVERRVLPQKHDIHPGQVRALGRTQGEMIALDVAHGQRLKQGADRSVAQGQPVGRVVEQVMAARLRLETQGERGVALDRDGGDMVHLDRDGKRHDRSSIGLALSGARARQNQSASDRENRRHMHRPAARKHSDQIESYRKPAMVRLSGQPVIGRADDAPAPVRRHGVHRLGQ